MINLYHGDCLEIMKEIPDGSVDMILCDLPYGEVNQQSGGLRILDRGVADICDIDLDILIAQLCRVCHGSFYIFCGTEQISQIIKNFKSEGITTRLGVWEKTNPSPMNGERLWLSGLEFCVFARRSNSTFNEFCKKALWKNVSGASKIHPTQKPIELMERLIRASSNSGDIILDCTMGSGSTGIACKRTNRSFIGIEKELEYFNIAKKRIDETDVIEESSWF